LVTDQVGDDRVVADAKLFWPENGKGKNYLISAFNQAYTYARDYNEPSRLPRDLQDVPRGPALPGSLGGHHVSGLSVNNKTVFFVVVDICEHRVPASKRGQLKSVDISDTELIRSVEAAATTVDGTPPSA
jgi:hypothetical protein